MKGAVKQGMQRRLLVTVSGISIRGVKDAAGKDPHGEVSIGENAGFSQNPC